MKRFFVFVMSFFVLLANSALADGDLWDNFGDQNPYGQKPVTDKEFDKALKNKQKQKKNKDIPKGNEVWQANESEVINKMPDSLPVVCISVPVQLDKNTVLPVGYYQAKGEIIDGKAYIKLYQSQYLIAQIPTTITQDDFGEDEINFIKMIESDKPDCVKFIFGSVDFNSYSEFWIAKDN